MHAAIGTHSFEVGVLSFVLLQIINAEVTNIIGTTFREQHHVEVPEAYRAVIFIIGFFIFVCRLKVAEIDVFLLKFGIQRNVGDYQS